MGQPKVNVSISNNNLGGLATSEDGTSALIVSGVAVGGQFALGDVIGPFESVADAEDKGIDAAYDTTNTCLAHKHISDFYEGAPAGTKLYVMVVAKTVRMTTMCDKTLTYAKKILSTLNGKVKLIGITMVPDGAYTPTYSGQLEADLATAITKMQELIVEERGLYRYCRALLEGRNWQGNASSTTDLRDAAGPNANGLGVVIAQDRDFVTANAHAAKYACVGYALGVLAGLPVQRSIARVKNGASAIANAGFSNDAAYSTLTDANLDSLHDKGLIFLKQHVQKTGYYFNKDNAACPLTDDFNTLSRGRVMDKVARITRDVYTNDIEDEVDVDPDLGTLPVATCKGFQGEVEKAIDEQMTSKGEISGVTAYCNPAQDVLSTSEIAIEVDVVPKGVASSIDVKLAYKVATA